MYIYLDESGDTGFKFRRGSSRYFVITLLIVEDTHSIEKGIDNLRKTLSLSSNFEFKFSKTHKKIKQKFFTELLKYQFKIRAIVVDKKQIGATYLRVNRILFYNFIIKLVLKYDTDAITKATLIVDLSKGKREIRQFNKYITKELGNIHKIKHLRSHSDNMIQVADMISGAIYRKFATGDKTYLNMLEGKIENILEFKNKKDNLYS